MDTYKLPNHNTYIIIEAMQRRRFKALLQKKKSAHCSYKKVVIFKWT